MVPFPGVVDFNVYMFETGANRIGLLPLIIFPESGPQCKQFLNEGRETLVTASRRGGETRSKKDYTFAKDLPGLRNELRAFLLLKGAPDKAVEIEEGVRGIPGIAGEAVVERRFESVHRIP